MISIYPALIKKTFPIFSWFVMFFLLWSPLHLDTVFGQAVKWTPAFAYDEQNNQILYVYAYGYGNSNILLGQILAPNFDPLGNEFQIPNSDNGILPAIAYDNGNHRFFVVWTDFGIGNDGDIHGCIVNPDGSMGEEIVIAAAQYDQMNPKIAFESTNQKFLVIWRDRREGFDLYGRIVNADGTLSGNEFVISETSEVFNPGEVIVDTTNHRFMVVWIRESWPIQVFGRILNPNGTFLGSAFPISENTVSDDWDQQFPSVGFDHQNQRYLVAWSDNRSGNSYGLYGQFVSPSGAVAKLENFQIVELPDRNFYSAKFMLPRDEVWMPQDSMGWVWEKEWEEGSTTRSTVESALGDINGSNLRDMLEFDTDPDTNDATPQLLYNPFCNHFSIVVEERIIQPWGIDFPYWIRFYHSGDECPVPVEPTRAENPSHGGLGDPLSTATGELYSGSFDLLLGGPMPLFFHRYYASLLTPNGNVASALGTNWMHNFDLTLIKDTDEVTVIYFGGKTIPFIRNGGSWELQNPERVVYQLIESRADFKLMDPSIERIFTFNDEGKLIRIEDRNGNVHQLTYDEAKLIQISDGLGRTLTLSYTSDLLTTVQDQSGRIVSFSHSDSELTGYTDARGNITAYTYTDAGGLGSLMTAKTLPEGNTPYTQTFDGEGRTNSQTDSLGNGYLLAYNTPENGVTQVTDSLANSYEHTHSDLGSLTHHKDQDSETITYTYDGNNRNTGMTDRQGTPTSITYDPASGKPTSFTDVLGNTTSFFYTVQIQGGFTYSQLTRVDFPDGTFVSMTYDGNGNLLTQTDQAGQVTTLTYNGQGQVLTVTNPTTGLTTFTYNADGTLAGTMDHVGNITQYEYDAVKRIRQITYPDDTSRAFTFDNNDNLLTETDELDRVTTLDWDANNQLASITDPLGNTTIMNYDGNDRIVSVSDSLDQVTTYTYNESGRIDSVTNPAGEIVTFGYNSHGWLTTITDPSGNVRTKSYDKEGVVTSITDPLLNIWNYNTDALGRVVQVSSPLSHTHSCVYNSMNRPVTYTNPLSKVSTFTYDNRGFLVAVDCPENISASYSRNDMGRITQITDPNGNAWLREFDEMGRMINQSDPLAHTTSYTYDSRNRLSTVTYPESSLTITYDESGNILRKLYSDSTDIQNTYDENDLLLTTNNISLTYDDRGDIIGCNGLDITRDGVGRIITLALVPGKDITYSYNARGLVAHVGDWVGGTTDLIYDEVGRIVSISRPNGIITSYTYDEDGRVVGITEENSSSISSITLARDGAGNITSADRGIPLDPIPDPNTQTFNYDAACQISNYSYDRMGHLTTDAKRTYNWDLASRMTSYSDTSNIISFTYDGRGMRVTRSCNGLIREYVWNYAMVIPSVSIIKEDGSDRTYYVHLPNGRLLHSVQANDDSRRFYHFNEMGTTLFLTDDAGDITDQYGITPFGKVTVQFGSTDNPFIFLGAYGVMQEGNAGLYYMRTRYYDANSVRFLSRESLWPRIENPSAINPYQYALNNPVRYTDISGAAEDQCALSAFMEAFAEMGRDREQEALDKFWEMMLQEMASNPIYQQDIIYVTPPGWGPSPMGDPGSPMAPRGGSHTHVREPGTAWGDRVGAVKDVAGAVGFLAEVVEHNLAQRGRIIVEGEGMVRSGMAAHRASQFGGTLKRFTGPLQIVAIPLVVNEQFYYGLDMGFSGEESAVYSGVAAVIDLIGPGAKETFQGVAALAVGTTKSTQAYDKSMENNLIFGWSHRIAKRCANSVESLGVYEYAQYIFPSSW